MIHGPCGVLNTESVYVVNGTCTNQYSKQFSETPVHNDNGRTCYWRCDDGRTVVIGLKEADNKWIVPFNPWLSKKFDVHINVAVCSSVKTVNDRANLNSEWHVIDNNKMLQPSMKVSTYLDAQYVSALEAMWHLLENRMHYQSHAVIR